MKIQILSQSLIPSASLVLGSHTQINNLNELNYLLTNEQSKGL